MRKRNKRTGEVFEKVDGEWVRMSPEAALAAEQGPLDSALIGAGRAFTELGRGAKELVGFGVDRDPTEEAAYAALQEESPIATAIGESAPYVGAGMGVGARGLGLGANMLRQARMGGALGLTMPGTPGERAQRGAIDAAAGVVGEGVGHGISRLFAPGMRPMSQGGSDVVARAEDIGYEVLPSSRAAKTDSFRNTVEGGLESTPGGASTLDRVKQRNQETFNRNAALSIGEEADAPTGDVLNRARTRIGDTFNNIMSSSRSVEVTPDTIAAINRIEDESIAPFIRGEADPIGTSLVRLREMLADGTVDAKTLMAQQSRLGKQARQAFRGENSNPELGHGLRDIQETLLDMARGSMNPAEQTAFDTARGQYRNLSTLETGLITNSSTGDVSPALLANHLQRRDPRGFMEGGNQSDLYTGARFLGNVQKPNKSSGTAERMFWQSMLGGGGGIGGAMVADENQVGGGLGGAAGALLLPKAGARAYLSNPMRGFMTRGASTLEEGAARAAGLGAAHSLSPNIESMLPEQVKGGLALPSSEGEARNRARGREAEALDIMPSAAKPRALKQVLSNSIERSADGNGTVDPDALSRDLNENATILDQAPDASVAQRVLQLVPDIRLTPEQWQRGIASPRTRDLLNAARSPDPAIASWVITALKKHFQEQK